MGSDLKKPKAVVITVNYRCALSTLEFVASLGNANEFSEVHVVIVDNASVEENASKIRRAIEDLPNVELLQSSRNKGYFGAARFGLNYYLAKDSNLPSWVIVCNHDTLIKDQRFFEKLFTCDPATVGVLAPRITTSEQGLDQNPFMKKRPGGWRQFTMRFQSSAYPLGVTWDWLSRQKAAIKSRVPSWVSRSKRNAGRQAIYAAHGAFMIFSRRFFEAGCKLDDSLFLYGEEISVAEMCRAVCLPIIYEPALSVVHNEHQSVGNGMTRRMFDYHRESVRRVLSKYLTS